MSTSAVIFLCVLCLQAVLIVVDAIIFLKYQRWIDVWDFYYLPTWVLTLAVMALIDFIGRQWLIGSVVATVAAIGAWKWWNNTKNRRRRKKMAERMAGRVVDLGGVLGVQPVED